MTQENQKTIKPRNLQEFVQALETPKIGFYRKIRNRCGASITAVQKWGDFDIITPNKTYLRTLSEETGIPIENLFKRFDNE